MRTKVPLAGGLPSLPSTLPALPVSPLWDDDLLWDNEVAAASFDLFLAGRDESELGAMQQHCGAIDPLVFGDLRGLLSLTDQPPFGSPSREFSSECEGSTSSTSSQVSLGDLGDLTDLDDMDRKPTVVHRHHHHQNHHLSHPVSAPAAARAVPRMPSMAELQLDGSVCGLPRQQRRAPLADFATASLAESQLRCHICEYQASKSWNFRRHMERRHPNAYKALAQFHCHCGRRFETKHSLCKHVLQTAPHNDECQLTKHEMDISTAPAAVISLP